MSDRETTGTDATVSIERAREAVERVRDACQQAILDLGEAVVENDESTRQLKVASGRDLLEGSTLRNLAALNETRVRVSMSRCIELARGLAKFGLRGRS